MNRNRILILALFLGLGFISVLAFYNYKAVLNPAKVSKHISHIPQEDRRLLEQLFRHLLISERFAYSLFGDKPLSMGFCLHTLDSLEQKPAADHPFTLKQWHTWEKYLHLFHSKNFVLREIAASKEGESWILIINKKRVLKMVSKHLKLFQSVLGPEITPQTILHIFLTDPDPLEKALKNRPLLKGLLFGYGKHNAYLFDRKLTVEGALIAESASTKPTASFETLQEELQHLTHQLRPFNPKDGSPLRLPVFLADPTSEETQELKQKYSQERDLILPLISDDSTFLENVLTAFTSG